MTAPLLGYRRLGRVEAVLERCAHYLPEVDGHVAEACSRSKELYIAEATVDSERCKF